MKDVEIHTVRVADHVAPGQDRLADPLLLDAIRDAIAEHGTVRLSFDDLAPVAQTTASNLSREMADAIGSQVLVIDVTRDMDQVVHRCMEVASRNLGAFPLLELISRDGGPYTVADDLHADTTDTLEAKLERMIELVDRGSRLMDGTDSLFERMMRPTARDLGITVIRCRDDHRIDMADFAAIGPDPAPRGFDYRARNAAPRSYRRR